MFFLDVVGVHPGLFGERLVTVRALAALFFQQGAQYALPVVLHRIGLVGSLFKILFVRGVEGVCICADFDVAADLERADLDQLFQVAVSVLRAEYPSVGRVVFFFHPPVPLAIGMSAFRPFPGHFPQFVVNALEGLLRDDVAVVHRPAAQDGIEFVYQVNGLGGAVAADDVLDLAQHGVHAFRRGLDEQFSVIFTEVLAKKIETVVYVGDLGLFLRQR